MIVCNSGPLIALGGIDQLELLRDLFGHVCVPSEVVGEARAIELACLHRPAVLLMDEARGRRVARDVYGLTVIGTGRVLVEAKRAGLIRQVTPLVSALRASGYWLSDKIVAEILRQAGE